MFARLMPHEGRFFTYFAEHAALIVQGAVEPKAMMDDMGETENRGSVVNVSTVRWGVAGNIVWAWIFTIPGAAFLAAIAWLLATEYF